MLKIRLIASLLLIALSSQAQESGNFSEKNLPEKNIEQNNNLPKISVNDAPIKEIQVNKASAPDKPQTTIESVLLVKRPVSLMFDDEELSTIERAVDSYKNKTEFVVDPDAQKNQKLAEEVKDNEKSFIYLASIIYFGANDWAVWINNQKITNKTNNPSQEIYLSKVKNDEAEIVWSLSFSKWKILSGALNILEPKVNEQNQVQMNFKLSPNQTYSLSAGRVLEGKPVIALIKENSSNSAKKPSSAAPAEQSGQ